MSDHKDLNIMKRKFYSERGWIDASDIKKIYRDNLLLMTGEYFSSAKTVAIERIPTDTAIRRWIDWCDECTVKTDGKIQLFGLINRDEIPDKNYTQFYIYLRPLNELLRGMGAYEGYTLICEHQNAQIEDDCLKLPFLISKEAIGKTQIFDQCTGDLIEYEAFGRQIEQVNLIFTGFSDGWRPNWESDGVLLELSGGEITSIKRKPPVALKWEKNLKLMPEDTTNIYEE